jgi:hypothetical protein
MLFFALFSCLGPKNTGLSSLLFSLFLAPAVAAKKQNYRIGPTQALRQNPILQYLYLQNTVRQIENSYLSEVICLHFGANLFYNPESMNIPTLLRRLSAAVTLLFVATSLSAQNTQFYVESVAADVDNEVIVNVRGINIDTLVGVQFSVQWDKDLLEFIAVDNVAMGGSQGGNFNQTQLAEGRIGYLEADGSLMGFGLADSTLLFTLRFDALTTVSGTTDITFVEIPLRTSARSSNNNDVEPDLMTGVVTLLGASSLATFAEDDRLTVAPNPFRDYSQISLSLNYGGNATLELMDISGRTLSRQARSFTPGNTTFNLSGADFPANGTYIVRLTTDREQLHRKVVFQGR